MDRYSQRLIPAGESNRQIPIHNAAGRVLLYILLYQAPNGLLYIGTNNSGLLIYDPARQNFEHYHKDNCALISNNIYTILSDGKDDILLSTEYGLSGFYLKEKDSITGPKSRDCIPTISMPTPEHCARTGMPFSEALTEP